MRYATLVIMALALAACNRDPQHLKQEYLKRGNDFFKAGKFHEADMYYRKSIEQDRKFGEAYYHLALAYLKEGSALNALRPLRISLEQLKKGTPDFSDASLKLSEILLAAAAASPPEKTEPLIKEVQGYTDTLIKLNPNSWEGHKLTADLTMLEVRKLLVQQKPEDAKKLLGTAINEYRAGLTVNPGDYSIGLSLARALEVSGELAEAETIMAGLTDKEKQNPQAYVQLYRLYLAQRKLPQAEALLKKAIQNNPKNTDMRLELARFYLATNKRDDLLALLGKMKSDLKEFPNAYVQAGDFFLQVNQFDEAIKQFEEGIVKDPDRKVVYLKHEIEVYVRSNRMQLATAKNEEILKIDPRDPEARGLKATLSLDKGEFASATTELQSVVTARPQNYVAHFNLGRAYLGKGDMEQARQEFDKAVQLNPNYTMARLAQTQVALMRGDTDAALHDADDLLRLQPSVEGLVMKATALQRAQRIDEARALIEPALQKNPTVVPLMLELGAIDLQQKKNKEAAELFHRAYVANPNNTRGLIGESQALLRDQQVDKSVEIIRAEVQKYPDRVDLKRDLGNAQAAAGQLPQAIATYQELLARFKDPKQQAALEIQIGQSYRLLGDVQHSIEAFEKSTVGMPDNAVTLRDLGMLYDELGRKDAAKQAYERSLKLDANDPFALNNLAYLLAENNGDLNLALAYAQKARQRLPAMGEITDTVGWIYMKKNLSDNAIDSFRTLVAQNPGSATYHYHYAMALKMKGDSSSARKECQAALADKPNKAQEEQIRQLLASLG